MICIRLYFFFFFSSRRRHTRFDCDWSSDVCSSDLVDHFYLLEETYELLEVIDRELDDVKFCEELGDVLGQVAMHAAIAEEQGRFDAATVSDSAAAQMLSRHPHVYGGAQGADAEEVLRLWGQA